MKIYRTERRVTASIRPEDVLIHKISEYPESEILEVIRHLGEESIAGFSPVQESEIYEVLAICEGFELQEILQKLQSTPVPLTASTKTIKTAQVSDPLQGMTNTRARKFVGDLIRPLADGFFKDDNWKPVHDMFTVMNQAGINYETYLPPGRISDYTQNEKGTPIAKEWWFKVTFNNQAGRETILYGHIQASGAGSIEQPLDRYDLTTTVF